MPLFFDNYGHIKPDRMIPISIKEIESIFVTDFPNSTTRLELFDTLIEYLQKISTLLKTKMHVFIDGSFVTQKENPNDIDLVIFIDYEVFDENEKILREYRCNLKQRKLANYAGIDAYIEKLYPLEHPHHHLDYLYWLNFFSKDRKGIKKGFLLLEIEQDTLEEYMASDSALKALEHNLE